MPVVSADNFKQHFPRLGQLVLVEHAVVNSHCLCGLTFGANRAGVQINKVFPYCRAQPVAELSNRGSRLLYADYSEYFIGLVRKVHTHNAVGKQNRRVGLVANVFGLHPIAETVPYKTVFVPPCFNKIYVS